MWGFWANWRLHITWSFFIICMCWFFFGCISCDGFPSISAGTLVFPLSRIPADQSTSSSFSMIFLLQIRIPSATLQAMNGAIESSHSLSSPRVIIGKSANLSPNGQSKQHLSDTRGHKWLKWCDKWFASFSPGLPECPVKWKWKIAS